MKVIVKCTSCHATQMTDCDTTMNITLKQGSKCEGCGIEFNCFSLHCMNTEERDDDQPNNEPKV